MSAKHVLLENDSFITYQGIMPGGHWYPEGATAHDARLLLEDFNETVPEDELDVVAHSVVQTFDEKTRRAYGDNAYNNTGFYPHLSWLALQRAGISISLSTMSQPVTIVKLRGSLNAAGLVLSRGDFMMAADLASGTNLNWQNRVSHHGGSNALFLYTGNIASRVFPSFNVQQDELLVESFVCPPIKRPRAS